MVTGVPQKILRRGDVFYWLGEIVVDVRLSA